jgi:hypothetical protein
MPPGAQPVSIQPVPGHVGAYSPRAYRLLLQGFSMLCRA